MYKIKESGIGKLVCNSNGCTPLYNTLSQKKLKELFNANCEFIEYEQKATTEQEASTQIEPVRSEAETDSSNGSSRRKANRRKTNKK